MSHKVKKDSTSKSTIPIRQKRYPTKHKGHFKNLILKDQKMRKNLIRIKIFCEKENTLIFLAIFCYCVIDTRPSGRRRLELHQEVRLECAPMQVG
jgi:hypothetical protein